MPDNINNPEIKIGAEREADRRVKQVTHRDCKGYLFSFNLPEKLLSEINTIVDVGSGFSTFSQEARQKFKNLDVKAVDPIYGALKDNPYPSMRHLEDREGIHLDFDSSYRSGKDDKDLATELKKREQFFTKFVTKEIRKHPEQYVSASHQELPFQGKSVDLVLSCNSILRSENSPQIIEKAIRECLRIAKDDGEIRIAGGIACLVPTEQGVELWYNGDLIPGSAQSEELRRTGHDSNPELMFALTNIEAEGANFYCVVVSAEENGGRVYRFDTLIIRKDQEVPKITQKVGGLATSDLTNIKIELRKLELNKNDGFNIPTVEAK